MGTRTAEVVICGAGIAGISTAWQLAVKHGMKNVVLADPWPPMTLTSDKSTEAYRNWWPGPDDAMVRLMNRSIDLLEVMADASDNRFLMNRRGYVYATANPERAEAMWESGVLASSYGAGPLRVHAGGSGGPDYLPAPAKGWKHQTDGADLILDEEMIRQTFPYLAPETVAVLHARRCGWFSGQQLGMLMLEEARAAGVEVIEGRVEWIETSGGEVSSIQIGSRSEVISISSPRFVVTAGPMLKSVGALLGIELPVFSELHLKISIEDHLGVVPRDAPFLIWEDPQHLDWSDEEREFVAELSDGGPLLGEMPPGVHTRIEGGGGSRYLLILWPYHLDPVAENFPLPIPDHYAEICVRGLSTMIPSLSEYVDRMPKPWIDGGYYTKTQDNRPLVGPLPIEGAFVHGALSGYGLMASAATAELVAAHIIGGKLPDYATAFHPARFDDEAYLAKIAEWDDETQL
ncbi:MAG: FAD-binding oxidoreductase [Acidobacteriota bacterium]|nr:FAD-binding oxidoreductase [Acidobacteriota bacterium]